MEGRRRIVRRHRAWRRRRGRLRSSGLSRGLKEGHRDKVGRRHSLGRWGINRRRTGSRCRERRRDRVRRGFSQEHKISPGWFGLERSSPPFRQTEYGQPIRVGMPEAAQP
jgi:hypothetical protein